jgi:predicted nucleic acid-binding protein
VTYFVDTSAFHALLDRTDVCHRAAEETMRRLREEQARLLTTNYVVVELFALVQRRLGLEALRELQTVLMPVVDLHWVDHGTHEAAIAALLVASRRRLSLVDCVSFEVMRRLEIADVFAFDPHFAEQGFRCHPS